MKYPSLKAGGLFWGLQLLLAPGTLLVLRRGAGSDRIRRIPFADIRRVTATAVFPVFIAMFLAVLLFFGVVCFVVEDPSPAFGALLSVPSAFCLLLCFTRKRSVIDIRSDAGSARIRVLWLSPRKRGVFLAALMAGVEQEQGRPVFRNGVPFESGAQSIL